MRRTVKIFGRSVPLTVVLLAVAVVAAGAWAMFAVSLWHAPGTTMSGAPAYEFTSHECTIFAGPGSVTGCTHSAANGVAVVVAGVDDTSAIYTGSFLQNTSGAPFYACFDPSGKPAYVSAFEPMGPNAGNYGPLAAGSSTEMKLRSVLGGLTPGIAISFDMPWKIQTTPCS